MKNQYVIRHTVCPLCEHGFMSILDLLNATIEGHDGRWERAKCPVCDTALFLSDTEDEALLAEDTGGVHERLVLRR
ncbi:MAG: hypothetical protein IJ229_09940 [Clostridia bacterium]|nr:hypothetical protein [Clostridia bacterium]